MIKWSLHGSTPIVKQFSDENFLSPVKSGPKMAVFRELRGVHDKFLFSNAEKGLESKNSVARYRIEDLTCKVQLNIGSEQRCLQSRLETVHGRRVANGAWQLVP